MNLNFDWGKTQNSHEFFGELIGTFILVFFGCGSVAVTVLFAAHSGLFQVAAVWGLGVTLAIYATRHLSCARLNPAVSVAMVLGKRMTIRRLPVYLSAQFIGAFLAAAVIYTLFSGSISAYETMHGIVRGSQASVQTALMFGEYYPNPGAGNSAVVSYWNAFGAEAVGTFILVMMIFGLTEGYGPTATYHGTIADFPHCFDLDDHHRFICGKPMLVCGNTASMVSETRYASHFTIAGDRTTHFGAFDCAPAAAKAEDDSGCGGACC